MKIGGCDFPDSLLYDVEGGTWAREEGSQFRLGLAPQLVWISGGYTSVSFKDVGSRVEKGKSIGSVEGLKHFDVVRAPFDCVVADVNSNTLADPRLINRDPYGKGWFALVRRGGGASSLKSLAEVSGSVQVRLKELGVKCFSAFPDRELFEVGVECSAALVRLNDTLASSPPGTVVHLVSDDPTSEIEMERWQMLTGNPLLESLREGSLYHFIIRKK